MDSFIRHFLVVNGHNPDNVNLMEEIISSCYSLHIILKSLLSSTVDLYYCLFINKQILITNYRIQSLRSYWFIIFHNIFNTFNIFNIFNIFNTFNIFNIFNSLHNNSFRHFSRYFFKFTINISLII